MFPVYYNELTIPNLLLKKINGNELINIPYLYEITFVYIKQ